MEEKHHRCQQGADLFQAEILERCEISPALFLLRLGGFPISFKPQPGQFLHIKVPGDNSLLLRRPISIQSCRDGVVTLLIREAGAGTRLLRAAPSGSCLDVLGPLGTAYSRILKGESVLMVGGGVGVAPLLACCLEAEAESEIDFCYGIASAAEMQDLTLFQNANPAICFHVSTDDGSLGFKGFCTERARLLLSEKRYSKIFTCGPWKMMHKAAQLAFEKGMPIEASLEVQMGCGLGACLGCVYQTPGGEYMRSCMDGPVVDGKQVVWE